MVKKDQLFILIKSLTKTEKRHFKLFVGKEKETVYLRLFDAIASQKAYDELKIRKEFAGQAFLKQLHVTKNYLKGLILQSLKTYHSNISKETEVIELVRNIEVLFHKELIDQCQNEITKVEKLCRDQQLYSHLLLVLNWKRKLIQSKEPNAYDKFEYLSNQNFKILDILSNQVHNHQIGIELAKNGPGNPKKIDISRLQTPMSLDSKVSWYNAKYLYNLQNGEPELAKNTLADLLIYLESEEQIIFEKAGLFISTANNLIGFLIYTKQIDEALQRIAKTKRFYKKWSAKKRNKTLLKQILRVYNNELEIYRVHSNQAKFSKEIADIQAFVQSKEKNTPALYLASFWFQFASIAFDQKDYKSALKWINQFLNRTSKNVRIDLQIQIRILNLFIHLHQKNFFVLRYFVENVKRFIKSVRPLNNNEKDLFRFFHIAARSPIAELKTIKADFLEKLENCSAGNDEQIAVIRHCLSH